MKRNLKAQMVKVFGAQDGFAKDAGVHPSRVSLVVSGRFNLTPAEKRAWARRLQYEGDIDELFRDTE